MNCFLSIERSFHAKYEPKSIRKSSGSRHAEPEKHLCANLFCLFQEKRAIRAGLMMRHPVWILSPKNRNGGYQSVWRANFVEWEKHKINFIDTPGDSNFAYDIKCSMSVVENAVIVVDAVGGVEFQTQKVWELAEESNCPPDFHQQTGSGTR